MIWQPQSIGFEQGVSQDDDLSHDGGDCDFGGLSGFDELLSIEMMNDEETEAIFRQVMN